VATAIGTVLALRSVTLRNELAGTVRHVALKPGEVVEAGSVLVALDVSVEQADLKAQQAQAELAKTSLARLQRLREFNATSEIEVDRARAERDVALAHIARTQAIIERKTIRVPFRARVGIADVHPGQYLNEGTALTTLQSVDDAVHVDFTVPQDVAAELQKGDRIEVFANGAATPTSAKVAAIDARVDRATRNTTVRRGSGRAGMLAPGLVLPSASGGKQGGCHSPARCARPGRHHVPRRPGKDGRARAQRPVGSRRCSATSADPPGPLGGEQVAASVVQAARRRAGRDCGRRRGAAQQSGRRKLIARFD
jgi:RND family efflux transporter MFP subunit